MLNKKLLRDIRFNKSQFVTIFLMVFLGVFVFSGIHAYMDGMKKSADKYYEQNNLQDIWISGENFTNDDLEEIKQTSNVKGAERVLSLNTTLDNFTDVTIQANFIESNNISKLYINEGEEFDNSKDGIWLDSFLADNLNLKVGDEITLSYQSYKITSKILGLVENPDHVYSVKDETAIFPNHTDYGYAYLSISKFPENYIYDELRNKLIEEIPMISMMEKADITNEMIEDMIPNFEISDYYVFNSVIVDVDDISKIEDTKIALENNIESAIAVTDRESNTSYEMYNSEIEEGKTYSSVFTFLFLFIAILSVITTMNRFVKKQRIQIGTLKAIGFKNRKIIAHYVGYGFYISLVAAILGLIIGRFTLGAYFMQMEMSYFEMPIYNTVTTPIVYILAIIVVVLITFITYLSCRKILKEPASETLRTEVIKIKKTNFNMTTKGIFKKVNLSIRWNLRDIARNKGRTVMAIVGIVGCTMLLVCAFGMLDTMNSYLKWQFETIDNFNYKLTFKSDYTQNQLNEITSKYGDATSQTLGIEIMNRDIKETNTLTVNDALEYLRYTDINRDYMEIDDSGVYITKKLADKLGLKVGDEISFHIFGNEDWYTCKIAGLNRDPQSQSLNMTKTFYESLGLEYKADSLYTDEDLSDVKELDGIDTIQSISNLESGMQSMLSTMKSMIVLLVIVAALLAFVIIYNLGILSFSEKQYQFATLKVLGFKSKQIKKIYVMQNIWVAIISIIIGLPLGYLMTDYIFKAALGDTFDFNAKIQIASYLYAVVGTFVVSIFVNSKLAKKIKTIDMVTSLKGNE